MALLDELEDVAHELVSMGYVVTYAVRNEVLDDSFEVFLDWPRTVKPDDHPDWPRDNRDTLLRMIIMGDDRTRQSCKSDVMEEWLSLCERFYACGLQGFIGYGRFHDDDFESWTVWADEQDPEVTLAAIQAVLDVWREKKDRRPDRY